MQIRERLRWHPPCAAMSRSPSIVSPRGTSPVTDFFTTRYIPYLLLRIEYSSNTSTVRPQAACPLLKYDWYRPRVAPLRSSVCCRPARRRLNIRPACAGWRSLSGCESLFSQRSMQHTLVMRPRFKCRKTRHHTWGINHEQQQRSITTIARNTPRRIAQITIASGI